MAETRKLRVFVCHAREDRPVVHAIYTRLLKEDWIDPWLDEESLLPGQNRDLKLDDTLKSTHVVLVCLSKQSLDQEGDFQREIRSVVDQAKEKPESSIFIIPIRLDDCEIPQLLRSIQYIDFPTLPEDKENAYVRIRRSMRIKYELLTKKTAQSRPTDWASPKESPSSHWVSSKETKVVDDLDDLTFGGFTFVKIPKGKFKMGSRASNDLAGEDEHPQWRYDIPYNYWITCFPITNEQFGDYVVSNRLTGVLPNDWKKKLDQPIVNVSWFEAVDYTKWLNKIFKNEIPNGLVFRLPTEVEWEKASRGDLGAEWPWGNDDLDEFLDSGRPELLARLKKKIQLDEKKNSNNFAEFFANFSKTRSPEAGDDPEKAALDMIKMRVAELRRSMVLSDVGTLSPITDSPYNVADMMGSVWEWTQSLYKPDTYDVEDGREDLKNPGERVVRGYFMSGSERFSVRSAKRGSAAPDRKEPYLGFRIVIAPPVL